MKRQRAGASGTEKNGRGRLGVDVGMFAAGERVCCAVSGGADSTALLLALVEVNGERDAQGAGLGLVLSAAHVHHGLRGADADADEVFVRDLCARVGVPLTVFRVDTAERQASHGEGVEEAARELRYSALRGLMQAGGADVVATGHTLDDQAETVMMKLLRGAWTEGLGGISPVVAGRGMGSEGAGIGRAGGDGAGGEGAGGDGAGGDGAGSKGAGSKGDRGRERDQGLRQGRIVRPMLGLRRCEVEAFLSSRGESWREDGSNRDLTLMRNRVRHELMPVLRGFNPAIDGALARMAGIAREEEKFWRAEVERLLPRLLLEGRPVRGGGRAVSTAVGERSCALDLARLETIAPALRRRLVRAVVRTLGAGSDVKGYGLSAEETEKVLALGGFGSAGCRGGKVERAVVTGRIGSRLELRGGVRVERSARELRFWREV